MNKEDARRFAKGERKKFSYNLSEFKKYILDCLKGKDIKYIAIFKPLEYEFDFTFLEGLFNVCYPKTNGLEMDFYSNVTKFKSSKFRVQEPVDGLIVNKEDISLMFVPCIAVNKENYRIGYGKGFYDRYLKDSNIYTISVAYDKLCLDFCEDKNDVKICEVILWKTQQ